MAGADPLGTTMASTGFVVLVVAAVCWVGATAPRRLLAWTVLFAGVSSLWTPAILMGLAVFAAVYLTEPHRNSVSAGAPRPPHELVINAALAGSALNLAARSELDMVFGLSSAVAIAIGSVIVVGGLVGQQRAARRVVLFVLLGLTSVALTATAAVGAASATVVDELRDGDRLVREGLEHLGDADLDAAISALRAANREFAKAEERLSWPVLRVGAGVPVVAQHREVAVTLSSEAADLTALVSDLLENVGPDALNVNGAQIDVEAVSALAESMDEIDASLAQLATELQRVSSPWLLSPATARLDDLSSEVAEQRARAENTIDVLAALPEMLGANGERVYLVMFTTPVEARGLGGFTANWAEITARDGRISMSGFGRTDELDEAADAGARTISGPSDWLERYGEFGFTNGPGGAVGAIPFKNVTMSPLMSSTGAVIAELYSQSGGRRVDGVFAADVYVVAELLRISGPVWVAGADRTLTADNAAPFLLNTQYFIEAKDERVELLEDASRSAVERLLGGEQELDPKQVLQSLGPLVEQGRLAGWVARSHEQDLLEQVGLAGTLVASDRDDLVTVAFNNAAGNKIDYFLESSGRYGATIDGLAGTVDGTFEVTMENVEPSEPQPPYVVDNLIDEPLGTNQTYVSVFTALPPSDVTVDGRVVPADFEMEGGYHVTSVLVLLPPGKTSTISVRVSGTFDPDDGYSLAVRSPPAVGSTPIDIQLDVVDANGSRSIARRLETAGVERVEVGFASTDTP